MRLVVTSLLLNVIVKRLIIQITLSVDRFIIHQTIPLQFMQKIYVLIAAFSLFSHTAFAQLRHLNLNVSVNGGYSELLHKTDFRTTPLYNLYDFVAFSHGGQDDYTWDQFLETYQIKDRFGQPRLGFSAMLTYRDWPIKAIGDAMSSPSSYTRASYAVTVGLGKDIYFSDSTWYFSFLGGYKYVVSDFGFGANTIVNSIGVDDQRDNAASFFAPVKPLGRSSGDLFAVRIGIARTLDWYYRWSAGVEAYYELDLTDKIVRSARMTTYGAQVFVRFKLFGKNVEPSRFYPNPAGGRRN